MGISWRFIGAESGGAGAVGQGAGRLTRITQPRPAPPGAGPMTDGRGEDNAGPVSRNPH